MAWARSRRRKTGRFWYVFDRGRTYAAGKGRDGRILAQAWAAAMTKAARAEKAGMPLEEEPGPCLWTLTDLYHADMTEARRRGLRTVQPQFQGKISKRESDWRQLFAFFGAGMNLDAITGERIRAFIEAREEAGVGPAAINRGLFGILRPALRLARDRQEVGFLKDPFTGIRRLDERTRSRKALTLSRQQAEKVIMACYGVRQELGAYIELLYLTGSRLNEKPKIEGDLLLYAPYKRGIARSFFLEGRLARVARRQRYFSRKLWKEAVSAVGIPFLRPHDLRHSRLTHEGSRPGASLLDIQRLGGWKSAAMCSVYLHPASAAMRVRL